jgi:hypothetical protein
VYMFAAVTVPPARPTAVAGGVECQHRGSSAATVLLLLLLLLRSDSMLRSLCRHTQSSVPVVAGRGPRAGAVAYC